MSIAKTTAGRSPLVSAARSLLSQRYDKLRRAVRRCKAELELPESIHQVRVATRRVDAALSLFAPLLAPRRARKLRKRLRQLRRAARLVRDCDVLLERLGGDSPARDPAAATRQPLETGSENGPRGELAATSVAGELRRQRRAAADVLVPELRKFSGKRGKQKFRQLRESLRWRGDEPEPGYAEAFCRLATPAIDAFEQAGACDLTDVGALHTFRLAGKRARYTLELLRDATDDRQTTALEEWLKSCQQQLGDINDHATAAHLLNELARRADCEEIGRAAEELAAGERRMLQDGAQRFAGWWRTAGREEAARALAAFHAGWCA